MMTAPRFSLVVAFLAMLAGSLAAAQAVPWQPGPGLTQIPLWPDEAPGAPHTDADETASPAKMPIASRSVVFVENVSVPTMTVFPAQGKNTGVAVVVFPGGGYRVLAIDLEGTEICEWLAAHGITGVLLKYRVPYTGPCWHDKMRRHYEPKVPMALQDAQRALGILRARATEWGIDQHKIGVLGFSAGGHLVADVATHFDKRAYSPVDAADEQSCRPDFGVPIYPGHMLENTTRAFQLNPKVPVTKDTPPMLIIQAGDDPVDPVKNSLVLYIALQKAGVPTELHLYAHGGHAFGLRPSPNPVTEWPQLLERWLRTIGMLAR